MANDVAITLPQFTVAIGNSNAAVSFPSLAVAALGNQIKVNASIVMPQLTSSFSGTPGRLEGTTLKLPAFTISVRTGLTTTVLIPQLSLSVSGTPGIVATYDKGLPRMTVNVKATQQSRGTFDVSLPAFTLDTDSPVGIISSASTRNLPILRLGATGFIGVNGDGAFSMPTFTVSTESFQSLNGTVVQSLNMLTIDAYADSFVNRYI